MAKQQSALSTAKTFNDLARRAADKGAETLALIWKAGETAKQAKEATPHGHWLKFVDQFYDVSHDTVSRWVKFHETVPESKLRNVRNLTAGLKMLDPPKEASKPKPVRNWADESTQSVAPGEDGRTDPDGQDGQESTPKPPRNGKAKRGGSSPKLDREAYAKQWDNLMGPIKRLVDKAANGVGEAGNGHQNTVHELLNKATDEMMEWMGVE